MYGYRADIAAAPLPPPLPKAIVQDPLPLTPERLHSALYACAPVGESTLTAHLYAFGIDNSRTAIDAAISTLLARGVRVGSVMSPTGVRFLTLPGQERVA